jgi:hypothetical protein
VSKSGLFKLRSLIPQHLRVGGLPCAPGHWLGDHMQVDVGPTHLRAGLAQYLRDKKGDALVLRSCTIEWQELWSFAAKSALLTLEMPNTPLGANGVAVLCSALLSVPLLRVLDLSGCDIGDKGVAWLVPWMRRTRG